MLVIVSVRRLDNDRIEIEVARPQHDSNPTHNYALRPLREMHGRFTVWK
jgi:hypothetical protein